MDSDGAILWQKTYGGTGEDWFRKILPAGDGTFTVQGITDSFGAGRTDIWLLKLNSDGSVAWQKTYGGSSEEIGKAWLTGDGGYAIVGGTDSFGQGQDDLWFLKLDGSGLVSWQKSYGGAADDFGLALLTKPGGGYVVAGATNGYDGGLYDAWVLAFGSDGIPDWQKVFGGNQDDFGLVLNAVSGGGYILGGHTSSYGAGDKDGWLVKLDAEGAIDWTRTYGGGYEDVVFAATEETADQSFILSGMTSSFGRDREPWLLRVDPLGQIDGCGHMASVAMTTASTTAVVQNTSATVHVTSVTPADSSAFVQAVPTSISQACYARQPTAP